MIRTASARTSLCLLLSLGATACTSTVFISDRQTGASGQTTVETLGRSSGPFAINLDGKNYAGRWVYEAGPATFSLVTANASSGGSYATASGYGMTGSTMGNGSILLNAGQNQALHCVFSFNSDSRTGTGLCQDSAEGIYDLQIN